jgi:hypothetical protein
VGSITAEIGDKILLWPVFVRRRAGRASVFFIVAASGNSCVVTMDGRFVLLRYA